MDFLFHFTFPLISSLIAISIIIFFSCYGRKSNFQPNFTNAVPVIEVIKALAEICPINSLNKWLLLPFDYGSHRCWMKNFSLPVMNKNMNLHGSAAILNSSFMGIGSLLADVGKWADWNPFYSSQFIVKSFHDKQLKRDHYMEAEQIVSIVREANKIQPHSFIFHDISENKVGWILFWHAKKLEFLFFLIQPVKNKTESPQCVLTHIMGTENNAPSSASLVLQRMRNIQDLLALSSVNLAPLKFTTSCQSGIGESSAQNVTHSSSTSQENFFSLTAARARKRDIRHSMFILVPFETINHWIWWKKKGFKLGVKNIENVQDKKFQTSIAKQRHIPSSRKEFIKHSMRRANSDIGLKHQILIDLTRQSKPENSTTESLADASENSSSESKDKPDKKSKRISDIAGEDSEAKCHMKTMQQQLEVNNKILPRVTLKCFSENALDNSELASHINKDQNKYNCERFGKLQHINENEEDKVLAMDNQDPKEIFSSSISDFEVVESCEYTENRIAGFMTQGNYGASELQAEVLLSSQFDQTLDTSNFQSAGGWVFHSHHKGLFVLSKVTSSKFLRISSFLCQTELSVSPKEVWKFVKNPQFRFICDETVKSVEVLEKISSSQKLIHTYHEVGGLLKKELVDFCLLQTEREELNKYYSCFYSIEFDKCPFMNCVTRGALRPSGWIVEESEKVVGGSKVTYMIQILINSPDSLLIHELSTLVPQSVHNLKSYITAKPM